MLTKRRWPCTCGKASKTQPATGTFPLLCGELTNLNSWFEKPGLMPQPCSISRMTKKDPGHAGFSLSCLQPCADQCVPVTYRSATERQVRLGKLLSSTHTVSKALALDVGSLSSPSTTTTAPPTCLSWDEILYINKTETILTHELEFIKKHNNMWVCATRAYLKSLHVSIHGPWVLQMMQCSSTSCETERSVHDTMMLNTPLLQ